MKILAIIISIISFNTYADAKYQLYCTGNRGKVALLIEKVESKIRFTYTNVEGRKDFPFYEGVVTEATIPFLKMAKKELNVIDQKLAFEWDLDKCSKPTDDSMIIACDGEAKLLYPPKAKLTSYDFFTSRSEEIAPTFTYSTIKIRLGLDTDSAHYLITMPFDPNTCRVIDENAFAKKI